MPLKLNLREVNKTGITIAALLLTLSGCLGGGGGGGGTSSTSSGGSSASSSSSSGGSATSGSSGGGTTIAPPSVPLGVFAVSGINQVTLTWPTVSGATSYNIYWGTAAGITTASTKINGATTPYVQTGLTTGNTYYYRVSAVNAGGETLSDEKFSFVYAGGNLAGTYVSTGNMAQARANPQATLLKDGTVLVTGGLNSNTQTWGPTFPYGIISNTYNVLNSTEIYNPTTGIFTSGANMTAQRWGHTQILLQNGKVLIVGGTSGGYVLATAGTTPLNSAEIYDPTIGISTATGSMMVPRSSPTATLLQNGKVLIAGGYGTGKLTELYDPATGQFTNAGNMVGIVWVTSATLLSNGKVILTGTTANTGIASTSVVTPELYDPFAGTFTAVGNITKSTTSATLLPNGKVLLMGQSSSTGASISDDLYDPTTNSFTATGVTSATGAALPLPNAKLFTGTGIFDPTTGLTTTVGAHISIYQQAALSNSSTNTLLPNGKVLVTGGAYVSGSIEVPITTAELLQ